MSTNKVNQWRIYCNTESAWSYGWLADGSAAPTTCFNNTAHTVNLNSPSIVNSISQDIVKISQEKVSTQGNFINETFSFTAAGSTTTTSSIQFPYTINLLAVFIRVSSNNIGDTFSATVDPGVYGTITSSLAIGVTVIPVDSTIINDFNIGYGMKLTRLSDNTTQDLGVVTAIDNNAVTITVTNATTQTFNLGDKVSIYIWGIRNMIFVNAETIDVGRSVLGSTYIPSEAIIYPKYVNNGLSAKTMVYTLEYLY